MASVWNVVTLACDKMSPVFNEIWMGAVSFAVLISIQRETTQSENYRDPSQAHLYDIRWVENETVSEAEKRQKGCEQQAPITQPYESTFSLPDINTEQVSSLGKTFWDIALSPEHQGETLSGELEAATVATSVIKRAVANPNLHELVPMYKQRATVNKPLSVELRFGSKAYFDHGATYRGLDENFRHEAIERQTLAIAIHNIKSKASFVLEDNAGNIDHPREVREKVEEAREKIEIMKSTVRDFMQLGKSQNHIHAVDTLLKIDAYIAYYNDPDFTLVMNHLFSTPIQRVLGECVDKESGVRIYSPDVNKLTANILLDFVETKDIFEVVLKDAPGEMLVFDYESLVEQARQQGVKDPNVLIRLHENKLLNRSVPIVDPGLVSKFQQNTANNQLRQLRYHLSNNELCLAEKALSELGKLASESSEIYYMAQQELNNTVSESLEHYGISPYVRDPGWRSMSFGEKLAILQDHKLATNMGIVLKKGHTCRSKMVQGYYKFPNIGNLTSKQKGVFNKLIDELVYKRPEQRTRYLLDLVWNSTNPDHVMLRKQLFLPNGVLKAYKETSAARVFTLDKTKPHQVQDRQIYALNNFLSFNTTEPEVQALVDLGLKAVISGNVLTGSEAAAWWEVQEAVDKCLNGNGHYQLLRSSLLGLDQVPGDRLQQVMPLVRTCRVAELKAEHAVAPDVLKHNPYAIAMLPSAKKDLLLNSVDKDIAARLVLEQQSHGARLLADLYKVDYEKNAPWLHILANCSNAERINLLQFIADEHAADSVSPAITQMYESLYSENKILRVFDEYEWAKDFKLNLEHSEEFQNKTARVANQLLFQYQNTLAVQDIARLEMIVADEEWDQALKFKINRGLEHIASANADPSEAAYYHGLAYNILSEVNERSIHLFPEYSDQLFPRVYSPVSPDIAQALEMGSNYAKFQGALNAVHIHFHPEGFSSKEVQSANKEYRKSFSKGLLLKTLTEEHPVLGSSKIGNVKLNKALDVDTQEALVLTANRLLAIRTDLENVKLIDRALVYVELANNNRSGDKAQTYLDTAEAMHKALNGNQAYAPFLNKEFLPSNASVEVQQSLLELCRQQEQDSLIMPCDNNKVDQRPEPEFQGPCIVDQKSESEFPGPCIADQLPKPELKGTCIVDQRPKPEFQGPCIVGDQVPEPLHMPEQTLPPLHGPVPNKEVKADDQEGVQGVVDDKVETETKIDSEQDEEVVESEKASEKTEASDADTGEKETWTEGRRGAYIDVDRTHPEAQVVDFDAAVEPWDAAESERWVEDVVRDQFQSTSIQELVEKIQPLVDYFNNHPAVKRLGIWIDAEKLVRHIIQGEIKQGRKIKKIIGGHINSPLLDHRFAGDITETYINHGETDVLLSGEGLESKLTSCFGPGWTFERILKVVFDAIENGRMKDPRIQPDHAGKIHIKTRCGMKIEIRVEKGGEISSFYPLKEWLKQNPIKCDGRCYKGLG